MDSSFNLTLTVVKQAYQAHKNLTLASSAMRREGIIALGRKIQASFDEILEANTVDLETSRDMAISEVIAEWLKLTPERLENTVEMLEQLANSPDITNKIQTATYQVEPNKSYHRLVPLGTIALIYEAFPELGAIATAMCLKTGNSLILRGCSLASNSNTTMARIIHNSLAETELPLNSVQVIFPDMGSTIKDLVQQDRYLDLIIPYGRKSLVRQVIQDATTPVLPTAIGNCYLYWSGHGSLELARYMIIDSHNGKPDAVNAIEKVLIHSNVKISSLTSLFSSLIEKGFELRGEESLVTEFSEYLKPMQPSEWGQSYMTKIVSFRTVTNIKEAVNLIHRYSSGHANCIVTKSYKESRQFAEYLESALVYINTSPRFERRSKCGSNVFLGMSNHKGNSQGLIGLESLTLVKQIVED